MEILDRNNSKNIREILEVWYSSQSEIDTLKSNQFINQSGKLYKNIRTKIKPLRDITKIKELRMTALRTIRTNQHRGL